MPNDMIGILLLATTFCRCKYLLELDRFNHWGNKKVNISIPRAEMKSNEAKTYDTGQNGLYKILRYPTKAVKIIDCVDGQKSVL